MDQPDLQQDATILSSLKQLEETTPMQKTPPPNKSIPSPRRNTWLLGFVVAAIIVSAYLFLSLGNRQRLSSEEAQILREGRTQQFDASLFKK